MIERLDYTKPVPGKRKGEFPFREIPGYPGYSINELGNVMGPAGYLLKPRWYAGKQYAKLDGRVRLVWSLLVAAGWQKFYDPQRVSL